METKTMITVEATVNAPLEKVWQCWTSPADIMKWNQADPSWHCPAATNDLRVGGKFVATMAAKDGSASFDFNGIYDEVVKHKLIAYTIEGGRKVRITFSAEGHATKVVESFEQENENPLEMQKFGWQSILNSFKKYTEKN